MSNPNPVIKIGRDLDPVELGSKGGRSERVETKITKELKKINDLNSNDYLKKIQLINPDTGEKIELFQIFLAGPKGFDFIILSRLSKLGAILTKLQDQNETTGNEFDNIKLLRDEIVLLLEVRDRLFGRTIENKTFTNHKGEVWDWKREYQKWLDASKEPSDMMKMLEEFRKDFDKIKNEPEEIKD